MIRGEYTTVENVRSIYFDIEGVKDDALILDLLRGVCREIDNHAGQFFYPLIETRYFDVGIATVGRKLTLDRPLLAVTTLTNGDTLVVSSTQYVFEPRNANDYPKWQIRLLGSYGISWQYTQDPENAIALAGVWGYHEHYDQAWVNTDTLGAVMSDTTGTVATLTTANSVKGGQLVKIDSEYQYWGTVSDTAVSNIVRGVNGSTAATHLISAPVYVWTVDDRLAQLAHVGTAMRYHEREHPNTDQFTDANGNTYVVPKDIGKWLEKEVMRLGLYRLPI